jgi:hypothetical protein
LSRPLRKPLLRTCNWINQAYQLTGIPRRPRHGHFYPQTAGGIAIYLALNDFGGDPTTGKLRRPLFDLLRGEWMTRDGKDHPDRAGLPRTAWRLRGSESREHETNGDKRERRHGEPPTPEYTAILSSW